MGAEARLKDTAKVLNNGRLFSEASLVSRPEYSAGGIFWIVDYH